MLLRFGTFKSNCLSLSSVPGSHTPVDSVWSLPCMFAIFTEKKYCKSKEACSCNVVDYSRRCSSVGLHQTHTHIDNSRYWKHLHFAGHQIDLQSIPTATGGCTRSALVWSSIGWAETFTEMIARFIKISWSDISHLSSALDSCIGSPSTSIQVSCTKLGERTSCVRGEPVKQLPYLRYLAVSRCTPKPIRQEYDWSIPKLSTEIEYKLSTVYMH